MVFRPATPGFLVTLIATGCLAAVTFCVPYIKSVFFLQATLDSNGINGTITFGTLGYCLDVGQGPQCTSPSVGYEFDPNAVLGINEIQIPEVVVKWITYALVLHIVALVLAAVSAVFGLLAHVREMSMVCCSTCVSGIGASIALIAFIFDLAFFFLVKSRINAIGGNAQIGNAVWLTLAAWILLFFAGCFYGFGQCCIRNRPRGTGAGTSKPADAPAFGQHADALRLDAVNAEADRKARQRATEAGLPAFQEHENKPLRTQLIEDEEEEVGTQPYYDHIPPPRRNTSRTPPLAPANRRQPSIPGYAAAPVGTRAVDEYYNRPQQPVQQPQPQMTYPPQPRQWQPQQSHTQVASHYPEISHAQMPTAAAPAASPMPGAAPAAQGAFLSAGRPGFGPSGHEQYPSQQDYGHPTRGTSYHSAHSYFPSTYTPGPEQQGQYPAGARQGTPSDSHYTPPGGAASYAAPGGYPAQAPSPASIDYAGSGGYAPASATPPQMPSGTNSFASSADLYAAGAGYTQFPQSAAAPHPGALQPGRLNTNVAGVGAAGAGGMQSPRQATSPTGLRGPRSPTSPQRQDTQWQGRSHLESPAGLTFPDQPPSYESGAYDRTMSPPREKS